MAQYLDKTGLLYYHSKITTYVNDKTANMLTKDLADTYYASNDVATASSNGLMSKDDKWAFNAICTYLAQNSASVVDSAINPEVWSICTFNGATVVPSSQISTGTVPVTPSAVVVWDGTTNTFVTRTGDDSAYKYYSTVDRSYGTASDTGAVPFENHIYVNVANDYSLHMYIGGAMTKISPTTISNSEIDTMFA